MAYRVSEERFAQLLQAALDELPEQFAQFVQQVPVEVLAEPDRSLRRRFKLTAGRVLGLYVGRPLTQRSVEDSGQMPDVIYLFQKTIESICDSEADLARQIRITLLHEIGHHFGMNEKDLEELGYQ